MLRIRLWVREKTYKNMQMQFSGNWLRKAEGANEANGQEWFAPSSLCVARFNQAAVMKPASTSAVVTEAKSPTRIPASQSCT